MTVCRGVNGGIQWLASNGRPELAGAASIIPRGFPEPDASLIADLNHVVKTAQDIDYEIKIWPIPVRDRRYLAFFDASFDSAGKRNQLGRIVGRCAQKTNRGEKDLFSMGFWKSARLDQSNLATSPNFTETKAAFKALADLTWYKAVIECLTFFRLRSGNSAAEGNPCTE